MIHTPVGGGNAPKCCLPTAIKRQEEEKEALRQ